jgi:hypothetical protein
MNKLLYPVSKSIIKREIGRVRHAIEISAPPLTAYWKGYLSALEMAILSKKISPKQPGIKHELLELQGVEDGLSFCTNPRRKGRQSISGIWLNRIKVPSDIHSALEKILKEKSDTSIKNMPDLRRKAYRELISRISS